MFPSMMWLLLFLRNCPEEKAALVLTGTLGLFPEVFKFLRLP